jgi:iron complex transport system ATP-binding protein
MELRNVSVTLDSFLALQDFCITVERGEWLGLIGPNGAGKTTVLRAIAGLVPFAGVVRLEGCSTLSLTRPRLARRVALVPQAPSTPPEMTVAEYVLLGRSPYIGYLAREAGSDRAAAGGALERLALLPYAERSLGSLSGGERQRAVLARALAQAAPLLLLDEPTAALDLGHQQQALELVDSLRRDEGLTVVSALHDLTLAGQYADRLVLLDHGSLVAEGSPSEVLCEERIAHHYGADVRVLAEDGAVFVLPRRKERVCLPS